MASTLTNPPPLPAARRVVTRPLMAATGALALGVAVDALALRRPLGSGAAIAMVLGLAVVVVAKPPSRSYPRAFAWLLPAGVATAVAMAWRASPTVSGLNLFAYAVLIAVSIRLYDCGRLRDWTFSDYVWRGSTAAAGIVADATRFVRHDMGSLRPDSSWRKGKPILAGLVAAIPVVVVFLALFVSADAVFAEYASRTLSIDIEVARFLSRTLTSMLLAGVAIGTWRAARVGFGDDPPPSGMSANPIAVSTMLIIVVALFALFAGVQARYLFGGEETLELTGLTYAEYARRGFFEMVTVVALVVLLVSVCDWLARGDGRSRIVDRTAVALVGLTFVVVASAAWRMRLYTDAFGLTEDRFYASVFMGWASVVLLLILATMLRGDRGRFAFGLLVSGLVFVLMLTVISPDRVIATVNLDRHGRGAELDHAYLATLSADAVPTLTARLQSIAEPCQLASALRNGTHGWETQDWRSDTVAHQAARDAMASLPDCRN